jgi:CcmD family protein
VEGSLGFLFAALIIVWVGIIGYLVMLGSRVSALQRELETLKARDAWAEDDNAAH